MKENGRSKVAFTPGEVEVEGSIPVVLSFFCCVPFFSFFLLVNVCVFTTEYLDLIVDYNYSERCWTTYKYAFVCTCHVFTHTERCCRRSCCSVCYATLAAAGTVRHRVPDGKICCCGSLHLIPVFSFSSSFKHELFLMYPLAVLSHLQPRFTYNTYHSPPLISGMRGPRRAPVPLSIEIFIAVGRVLLQ